MPACSSVGGSGKKKNKVAQLPTVPHIPWVFSTFPFIFLSSANSVLKSEDMFWCRTDNVSTMFSWPVPCTLSMLYALMLGNTKDYLYISVTQFHVSTPPTFISSESPVAYHVSLHHLCMVNPGVNRAKCSAKFAADLRKENQLTAINLNWALRLLLNSDMCTLLFYRILFWHTFRFTFTVK